MKQLAIGILIGLAVGAVVASPPSFEDQSPGFPVRATGDSHFSSPTVADVNGDGLLDVVAGNHWSGSIAFTSADPVQTLWNIVPACGIESVTRPGPAVGSVAASRSSDVCWFNGVWGHGGPGLLHCVDGATGADLAGFPISVPHSSTWTAYSVAMADFAGDGRDEIVFVSKTLFEEPWIGVYEVTAGAASLLPGFPVILPQSSTLRAPAVGDVAGDSRPEIAVLHNYPVGGQAPTVHLLDADGGIVWTHELDGFSGDGPPVIADMDGNGSQEVIAGDTAGVYAINASGQRQQTWAYPFATDSNIGIAVANLDADRELEVVATNGSFDLVAFDDDGTTLPGWPIVYGFPVGEPRTPVVADVDGDGLQEIVTQLINPFATYPQVLVAYNLDASTLWELPLETNDIAVQWETTIADVDNDGSIELLTGGNFWNGTPIFCGDANHAYEFWAIKLHSTGRVEWGSRRYDQRNTGRYVPYYPGGGTGITDCDGWPGLEHLGTCP